MRLGVCVGIRDLEKIKCAKECGFDYVETRLTDIFSASDEEYEAFAAELKKYDIACEATNCFITNDFQVTTTNYDVNAAKAYLEKTLSRAAAIGVKKAVFGSSGARHIEPEIGYAQSFRNMAAFVKNLVVPAAEKYDVRVVFEPLCRKESDFINTVKEGAMLAAAVDSDRVGVLADIYHMHVENDKYSNISDVKGLLWHAHISNPESNSKFNRIFPKVQDTYDYAGFFAALEEAGCETCSIEASTDDFCSDLPPAMEALKKFR